MSDVSLMNQSLAMDRTISPEQLADVPVYALMNGSWLAVGVGPDVHVFDIGSEYRYSACISLHGSTYGELVTTAYAEFRRTEGSRDELHPPQQLHCARARVRRGVHWPSVG